ncbi:50S ribosomal protein L24 [Ahrensia sp. R2A130]|uniref:50S ribosomal protein L24 n=1 Tax=Ahrensia sp. R2A130 TaxID=744979 RepID=UPI0001E0A40F|nr:50S ribosomal protein L24 [Ahrensia sp. R2A130]EFL90051.1 ribosomal protein L24 [Ahrensia sp. R2A130]
MNKIKKGDTVVVLSGKDKGRSGTVLEMITKTDRVLVQGVNMVKRHTKQSQETEGGIIAKEASLHISNLALADPKDGKATRVGIKTNDDGKRVRFAKRSGDLIDG